MIESRSPQTCASAASTCPSGAATSTSGASRTTGIVADPFCKQHLTGPGHPERPERFDAVMTGLATGGPGGLLDSLVKIESRPATESELLLCHTPAYVRDVQNAIETGVDTLDEGDTRVSAQSWEAGLRTVGGILNAVDAVATGKVKNAFCAVRPPGHHASADRAMGFCFFNNIAIAARHAQARHSLKKALIIDWDVHHGNGTQDIFYEDGSVFFFSTHQSPWYPGTGHSHEKGARAGEGTTLNCPLPAGSGSKEILHAFTTKLLPAADAFRPDIVLISAGFDSRQEDPLGNFALTDPDFAELTHIVAGIAQKHAAGKLISILEGGYNLQGLAAAAHAHVKALTEAA